VAGPVGEALIMTAIGLAVAIPAVLAYNAFIKANRGIMAELESFAQDLHTLLTTGAPLMIKPGSKSNVRELHTRVMNKGGNP
jgi:biopolymer transport protein ExbB